MRKRKTGECERGTKRSVHYFKILCKNLTLAGVMPLYIKEIKRMKE